MLWDSLMPMAVQLLKLVRDARPFHVFDGLSAKLGLTYGMDDHHHLLNRLNYYQRGALHLRR